MANARKEQTEREWRQQEAVLAARERHARLERDWRKRDAVLAERERVERELAAEGKLSERAQWARTKAARNYRGRREHRAAS